MPEYPIRKIPIIKKYLSIKFAKCEYNYYSKPKQANLGTTLFVQECLKHLVDIDKSYREKIIFLIDRDASFDIIVNPHDQLFEFWVYVPDQTVLTEYFLKYFD